jgi:hypothetical protein
MKYKKIYLLAFGFDESDWIPCEVCQKTAVDIHHIDARGMGGSNKKDHPSNLMALCRECHIHYGDKKQFKSFLKKIHNKWIKLKCS